MNKNSKFWLISTGCAILLTIFLMGYIRHNAELADERQADSIIRADSINFRRMRDSLLKRQLRRDSQRFYYHSQIPQAD